MKLKGMVKRHFVCVPLDSIFNVDKAHYKDAACIILEAKPTKKDAEKSAKIRRNNAKADSIHQFCYVRSVYCDKAAMIPKTIS